ncbi:hypothetical protein RclHR1_19130003 [Rhizophagus clarus]|uniref:Uncharacterized protein n=1 Tax=Rhizophagus clarus TaxID=94130 RepID=A0A2Z6QQM5_9GLOM|nr:hypothetical protein RclHR1_19130003 [Rhizophagus clarus]
MNLTNQLQNIQNKLIFSLNQLTIIQNQLTNIQNQFTNIHQNVQVSITGIQSSDTRAHARQLNSLIVNQNMNLEPVPEFNGMIPLTYPRNIAAIRAFTGLQLA